MLSFPTSLRIFVAAEPVDFRKAFDGLCAVVRDTMQLDPFDDGLFVFFNKRRDRTKLLFWDRNGFWLLYKRLERGTFDDFHRATEATETHACIDASQLRLLLDGVDMKRVRFRKHFKSPLRIDVRRHDGRRDRQPEDR